MINFSSSLILLTRVIGYVWVFAAAINKVHHELHRCVDIIIRRVITSTHHARIMATALYHASKSDNLSIGLGFADTSPLLTRLLRPL
jgi:hypothetical protein